MSENAENELERIQRLIHDLRQPLGVISVAVDNIRLKYRLAPDQVDEPYVLAKLGGILKQIDRIEERFGLETIPDDGVDE